MTDSDKIQTLPLPFLERMKEMLGDDYDAFLKIPAPTVYV